MSDATDDLDSSARKRSRRRVLTTVWAVIGVLLIVAAIVVADVTARAYAEGRVSDEIESRMPAGVSGEVDVTIGGVSVIGQYLAGRFEHIELDAPGLTVEGVDLAAHVIAEDVPTSLDEPVGTITATVTLDQEAVNRLLHVPGVSEVTLGDGTVTFTGSRRVFGLPISYQAEATVEADGMRLLFAPERVEVTAGPGGLDLTEVAEGILGGDPIAVCTASSLPKGVEVTDARITSSGATLRFEAHDLVLSADTLATKGSCG